MRDKLGRNIDHLRVSLTTRCDYKCVYCHKEGNESEEEMTTDEVFYLLEEARKAGMLTIKFTGGEPLLRTDIVAIVKYSKLLGYRDISMTTNGRHLGELAKRLHDAGLERVNIGCDSVSKQMPKNCSTILEPIKKAKKAKLSIKLNMVVLKGVNESEIDSMIEFCKKQSLNLQLIELVDLGNEVYDRYFHSLRDQELELSLACDNVEVRDMQRRKRYYFGDMFVEIVRPNRNFCKECNKVRVTSDGKIKNCLMKSTSIIDFKNRWSIEKACSMRDSCGYD